VSGYNSKVIFRAFVDIKDLVVDLVHAIGKRAYVCLKVEIGMAIFFFCFLVELL